jgi:hypothetical protein
MLLLPAPAAVVWVVEPYEVVVPYWNHQSVASAAGLTVPLSVAVVPPTALTGPVIAVGAASVAAVATAASDSSAAVSVATVPLMTLTLPRCRKPQIVRP